jgi:Glycosyltransferase like family 2
MTARGRRRAVAALSVSLGSGALLGAHDRAGPPLVLASLLGVAAARVVGRRAAGALAAEVPVIPGMVCSAETCGGPALTIVVPARNEAAAVPRLMADLGRQCHRSPDGRRAFEVVLVDDGSTDGTAAAAEEAACRAGVREAVRVVRVDAGSKGSALAMVPAELVRSTAVLVLDADARIPPGALCALARRMADVPAATGRRRSLNAPGDPWSEVQDDEQSLDGALQALRWRLGGAPEFRGNGMILRTTALADAGGWRPDVLTEDLELSTRLLLAGTRIAWAGDVEIWEDAAPDPRSFARQRLRWAEGSLRRLLEVDLAALARAPVPGAARLDAFASAGQVIAPPGIAGFLAGAVVAGRPRRALGLALVLGAAAWLVAHPVLTTAARLDADRRRGAAAPPEDAGSASPDHARRPRAPRIRGVLRAGGASRWPDPVAVRTARLTVYLAHWIPALVVALGRIAVSPGIGPFRGTPHPARIAAPWDPPTGPATAPASQDARVAAGAPAVAGLLDGPPPILPLATIPGGGSLGSHRVALDPR